MTPRLASPFDPCAHRGRRVFRLTLAGLALAAAVGAQPPVAAAPAATPAPPPKGAAVVPPTAPTPPAPPPVERVQFEFKLPADQGGGSVTGTAGSLETEGEDKAILSGKVELKYRDMVIHAERLVLLRAEQRVLGEGEVVLDQGPRRLSGKTLDYNLETRTGTLTDARAFVQPDLSFTGKVIEKVGEKKFRIQHGTLTSCTGDPTPDWSFRMTSARVELEGYAHIFNTTMWTKKLPVFYLPYVLWPAKLDRASGLLVPNIGYSERRGEYLGLAYFQTLGRSYDTTFYYDWYGKGYYGGGNEFRYRPTAGTRGETSVYFINDVETGDWRWKASWDHESADLPGGMRGVVSFRDFSDFDFFRDFERGSNLSTVRRIPSRAFLSGSWGAHSLNVLVERVQTFLSADSIIEQERLPEIDYNLSKLKLGRAPLYLSFNANASFLSSGLTDSETSSYGRVDLAPELTLPLRLFPWLNLSVAAGGRATWYGDSLPQERKDAAGNWLGNYCGDTPATGANNGFCGAAETRIYPTASAEVVGPVFTRIFETARGPFSKLKHIIEPRWSYSYVGTIDHPESFPLFDERDRVNVYNLGEFALVNRVLAKPRDPKAGGAREILSFSLAQAFSFDDTQPLQTAPDGSKSSSRSALFATLRFYPAQSFTLQAQAQYNTLFGGLDSTSLSATLGLDRVYVGLNWFTRYQADVGETSSDQMRVSIGLEILPKRLSLESQLNYDLLSADLQQQRYTIVYNSQCWGVRIELREFTSIDRQDRDYRFALTLKNVGTFLDLTGGDTTLY